MKQKYKNTYCRCCEFCLSTLKAFGSPLEVIILRPDEIIFNNKIIPALKTYGKPLAIICKGLEFVITVDNPASDCIDPKSCAK